MAKQLCIVAIALLAGLAAGCAPRLSSSPHGFWQANRLDRHGDPVGRWNLYYDDAHAKPLTQGHYRRGQARGRWRYFAPTGGVVRQEYYRAHGLSDITYYHTNGQVARQGQARVVTEPDGLHFYWFGDWLNYSEAGVLQKIETYQNGHLVVTRRVQTI
jgi:antitoxin component YwqK of YwqJK toxin-antitoxin module